MKHSRCIGLGLIFLSLSGNAAEIVNSGILGNSGEQGAALVKSSPDDANGMGALCTPDGSLWDRAGSGVLNRYSVDGRLLATYEIPQQGQTAIHDGIWLLDGAVTMKIGGKLFRLPLDAPSGSKAEEIPTSTELLHVSYGVREGRFLATDRERNVFLVNGKGEMEPAGKIEDARDVICLDFGPDGGQYAYVSFENGQGVIRIDLPTDAPASERGPWPGPGGNMQWLEGSWFAHAYHGTIRRFNAAFEPDPGVVLGGNSGAFIGYVPENSEQGHGRGLAAVSKNLVAVSGEHRVLHLLRWKPLESRFEILSRIGSVPACQALAIDEKGAVYLESGVWPWDSAPDTPLIHGVPAPEGLMLVAEMAADNRLIGAAKHYGKPTLYLGPLSGPADRRDANEEFPAGTVAGAVISVEGKGDNLLLLVDATGKGHALSTERNGEKENRAKKLDAELQFSSPVTALTSLASISGQSLVAGADGWVIHLEKAADKEGVWKETKRWREFTGDQAGAFGAVIHLDYARGKLWVADTENHRVLCFDPAESEPKPLAVYGSGDAGSGLEELNRPAVIATNGQRTVVFDSANQRIVRLEFRD